MSGLFSPPKVSPPKVPTRDEARESQQIEDNLRKRKGTAATILTSPLGAGAPQTATKTLMGQ